MCGPTPSAVGARTRATPSTSASYWRPKAPSLPLSRCSARRWRWTARPSAVGTWTRSSPSTTSACCWSPWATSASPPLSRCFAKPIDASPSAGTRVMNRLRDKAVLKPQSVTTKVLLGPGRGRRPRKAEIGPGAKAVCRAVTEDRGGWRTRTRYALCIHFFKVVEVGLFVESSPISNGAK
eukprot:scaffold56307_cov63-Phaeocystis_antarctica.AAC.6